MIKALKTLFNGVMRKFSKCLRVCHSQHACCGCRWARWMWGENDDRPLLNEQEEKLSSGRRFNIFRAEITCVHALWWNTTPRQLAKPQCNYWWQKTSCEQFVKFLSNIILLPPICYPRKKNSSWKCRRDIGLKLLKENYSYWTIATLKFANSKKK